MRARLFAARGMLDKCAQHIADMARDAGFVDVREERRAARMWGDSKEAATVRNIYAATLAFFGGTEQSKTELRR